MQTQTISERDSFWTELYNLARKDSNIVVVAADMGAPALDKFRKDLGGQFINSGIAEQSTVTTAAGLSMAGKKVFAYAIAPFITLRAYEQTKCVLAAMNIPVTLVGVGSGFSYEDSGPTHHTIEDLSIMRILPNLTVHNASDHVMAASFARLSLTLKHPNYVRLDRLVQPTIYKSTDDFSSGLFVLRKSKSAMIVATGNMVHNALGIADSLKKTGVDVGVIDLFTLPIPKTVFLSAISGVKKIITMEEHTLPGGLGSAVLEVLSDNGVSTPVKRIGLNFENHYCYQYGGRETMQKICGIDTEASMMQIKHFLRK